MEIMIAAMGEGKNEYLVSSRGDQLGVNITGVAAIPTLLLLQQTVLPVAMSIFITNVMNRPSM